MGLFDLIHLRALIEVTTDKRGQAWSTHAPRPRVMARIWGRRASATAAEADACVKSDIKVECGAAPAALVVGGCLITDWMRTLARPCTSVGLALAMIQLVVSLDSHSRRWALRRVGCLALLRLTLARWQCRPAERHRR